VHIEGGAGAQQEVIALPASGFYHRHHIQYISPVGRRLPGPAVEPSISIYMDQLNRVFTGSSMYIVKTAFAVPLLL
jgi:hypothetical protein